jgi:DNA-3-methyladenine glycosylase I
MGPRPALRRRRVTGLSAARSRRSEYAILIRRNRGHGHHGAIARSADTGLVAGADGRRRCWWGLSADEYVAYHDDEWGRPVVDDYGLFERLCLEAFQSGLSWLTILRKREHFRRAFSGFRIPAVAAYGAPDVERLLGDSGIVRNRAKIEAAIANAQAALRVVDDEGSFSAFVWGFAPRRRRAPRTRADLPGTTPESRSLARELKLRGFRFVGPTTAYAAMQACGLVNDHLAGCFVRARIEAERRARSSRS